MTTKRARALARAALTFDADAPSPRSALRQLIQAVAADFHDGDPTEAVLSMLDDRDAQFADLLLLATGINLGPADPVPGAADALAEHAVWCRWVLFASAGDPTALARLVTLTALVHHRGARRAAVRAMVDAGDDVFGGLFARLVGVEL